MRSDADDKLAQAYAAIDRLTRAIVAAEDAMLAVSDALLGDALAAVEPIIADMTRALNAILDEEPAFLGRMPPMPSACVISLASHGEFPPSEVARFPAMAPPPRGVRLELVEDHPRDFYRDPPDDAEALLASAASLGVAFCGTAWWSLARRWW